MRPFGYKVDLNNSFATFLLIINMAHEYHNKAKLKFPFPEYPQEDKYNDPVQYKAAITHFGAEHSCILAQHDEWVDCECITDIVHTSKAAHQQAEADKWHQEVEEEKAHQAAEGEKCPRKWGRADT